MSAALAPLVPPVLLLGPSGAGKSTVAPLLAARLGFSVVDLDARARAVDLATDGLPRLRVREHLALKEALTEGAVVVATGAGVIDVDENHPLLRKGVVVVIDVDHATSLSRLRDALHRPWLPPVGHPDRASAFAARENDRAQRRRQLADIVVDGSGPAELVAAAIERAVRSWKLPSSGDGDVHDMLDLDGGTDGVVIADRAVAARLPRTDVVIDIADDKKRFALVESLLAQLIARGVDRRHTIVAVGGGVLLDVVGLTAALHHRGTPWRCVPTTLLAMVDAGLGGKTAVDVVVDGALVRNAAGRFHPPASSHVWPGFLSSLSPTAIRHGRAEMLKHLLLGAHGDDEGLDAKAIAASRGFKAAVVDRDPDERHLRHMLNFGHTFAHAIESRFGYAHGDAVLHGLQFATELSALFAGLDGAVLRAVQARVAALAPPPLPALDDDDRRALLAAMGRDKKRPGRFVLLSATGTAVLATLPDDVVDEALRRL